MDNNEEKKIRVAITHGDINGVGYEVIIKTFSDSRMFDLCTPVLYGSSKVASYHKKLLTSVTQEMKRPQPYTGRNKDRPRQKH